MFKKILSGLCVLGFSSLVSATYMHVTVHGTPYYLCYTPQHDLTHLQKPSAQFCNWTRVSVPEPSHAFFFQTQDGYYLTLAWANAYLSSSPNPNHSSTWQPELVPGFGVYMMRNGYYPYYLFLEQALGPFKPESGIWAGGAKGSLSRAGLLDNAIFYFYDAPSAA